MEDEDCLETCIHCEARLSHPQADSCRKCGKLQFTSAESTSARESSQTAHSTGPEEAEPANVPQPMEGVVEENAKETERASLWTPKPIIEDAAKKNEIEMETPEILAAEKKVRDNSSKRRKWDDLDEGTKQFHVSELALLCTTRAKHKKTLDDYITNLARLKSIPTQNMPTMKEELDVQIAVVEDYIKSGNEFMSRIMKMAEYYMRDSPLLNEQWEKEAVGSETSETRAPSSSFVGSCEHAASQVSDELDAIGHLDTSNEKMTYKVSKIIADQIVPQSLYREFNYQPDEILPASIEDPEARRRMRLRTAQMNMNLKKEVMAEIEELETKITQDRQILSDEVGEERLEGDLQTSIRWKPIDENIDRLQAKWKWVDQLNYRIAKSQHPCQDFGPRSATPVMLVEIKEFYKQLVIKDNQEGLDKRIEHYVSKMKNRKLAAEIQTRMDDLAKRTNTEVPFQEQRKQVAAEIENKNASENLGAKIEEKKEMMKESIDLPDELMSIIKDSTDFIESGPANQEDVDSVIESARSELADLMLDDQPSVQPQSARESSRETEELIILDGTMMCKHCNSEMDLRDTICPTCLEVNEISVIDKDELIKQQRQAQKEHLRKLKVVVKENTACRGQQTSDTRTGKNARRRLRQAKAAGYNTIREFYEKEEALKLVLFENKGWNPEDTTHMEMFERWLKEQDEVATTPIRTRNLPPTKRKNMFQGTTVIATTQGGDTSKMTVPSKCHPEYQATLEQSDSVADARKRKAEWGRSWQREEPPTKTRRCECGAWYEKVKMDRETVLKETGAPDEDWRKILNCQSCDELMPGADLLYARCTSVRHKSWICTKCFEDPPENLSARESARSDSRQDPQPESWWSSHSHSSSGWDGSYRESSGWWVNRAETPNASKWYK